MSFSGKLIRVYFDYIYNPVYDFTTAQRALYKELQNKCIDKFEFDDGNRVLCAGIGTGNEIVHILKRNSKVSIVGVDYSSTVLRRAYKKALALGATIEALHMDIRDLKFSTGSFDKVLCLHVMDFIHDDDKATAEIIRVLRSGGEFVITYPSEKEGAKLGINLLRDSFRKEIGAGNRLKGFSRFLAQTVMGMAYLPLLLRPKKRKYTNKELRSVFVKLAIRDFRIDAYPMYQDFIVYGRK